MMDGRGIYHTGKSMVVESLKARTGELLMTCIEMLELHLLELATMQLSNQWITDILKMKIQ
ncbi:MAG: hypothetical protein F6K00_31425 [Leptolyngbya sp. SIOISBB]|nr:hypothetical protein [Leptolyngbya sp. SIOISBB]